MPSERMEEILAAHLSELESTGRAKGAETVFCGVQAPEGGKGPRYLLAGDGERPYLRMNSNSYLGMSLNSEVQGAEEAAVQAVGAGPGAVRFISGTWSAHTALEQRLAHFHGRQAAMIFSSAYAPVMGVLPQLIDGETVVISDALNHNCIINAIRLARPREKRVYAHLDLAELDRILSECAETCRRALVVTDGIFSMRGDHAPLDEIMALAEKHDSAYAENVIIAVDDSHGVGAFGDSGRGTEEYCAAPPADVLIATLGKAFGVNGGYVTASATVIDYLRETSPFYIYSNPITPGEAAAAMQAVEIVDSEIGRARLAHLRAMTARFEAGLVGLGFETIPGGHPVVPLMVRDTARTTALVAYLRTNLILATGLNFPVVPKGDEEIRFQISADHTAADIDEALAVLKSFADEVP
ncbi:MAG: aminotransferase class I/II-fold pyridoxal phosphate-dependent enzyme [Alphaproteobacteria bacterium]|nr:aminotransferase class I/II-fold pyridoxal phosphate-dependent enzyme [Alphaproteobacteria bacterium]MDP6590017.1 aminotransferase class I/II-fold pyridoxal phosphate-dependent enzyme [Alphaproteobacteria bacterium]MDP6817970.1 aminotransferase class I/II-fold pyridoxal phosphate-dependent enzyme [Alphaproteobacteria bacterium]